MQRDKFFYAAMAFTMISLAYFITLNINLYLRFKLTTETALYVKSFFFMTHLPNLLHGFQFLVFGCHIAPDQLLFLPLYYFFPSALTLMIIKAILLSLSGLLIFLIARDLLESPGFALVLSFTYFISIGTFSMQLFEYHPELLIVPFYMLTFYFWMKLNKKAFYFSLFLLLGVFESVLSIVACLGLGILFYEYFYDKSNLRRERMKLGAMIIICMLIALILYNSVYFLILSSYPSNRSLLSFSPDMILQPFPLVPLFNSASYNYPVDAFYFTPSGTIGIAFFAFMTSMLSLGISSLAAFIPTLLMIAPWLGGLFILHNIMFLYAWRWAYAVPETIVGAILGYIVLRPHISKSILIAITFFSSITLSVVLVPKLFGSRLLVPNSEIVFFQFNNSELLNDAQLNALSSLIPANAHLMTQQNLYPFFSNRQYAESLLNGSSYFTPEYILWDPNVTVVLQGVNESEDLWNWTRSNNYTIFATSGSAVLYKLK